MHDWTCFKPSNLKVAQTWQNKIFRLITKVPSYVTNLNLYQVLRTDYVTDAIKQKDVISIRHFYSDRELLHIIDDLKICKPPKPHDPTYDLGNRICIGSIPPIII